MASIEMVTAVLVAKKTCLKSKEEGDMVTDLTNLLSSFTSKVTSLVSLPGLPLVVVCGPSFLMGKSAAICRKSNKMLDVRTSGVIWVML